MTVYRSHRRRRLVQAVARLFAGLILVILSGCLIAFISSHGWAVAILIAVLWGAAGFLAFRGSRGRG